MPRRDVDRLDADDRAVTVSDGVAGLTLVVLALLLGGGLGAGVLLGGSDDGGPPSANFTFQHLEGGNTLVVRHDAGDSIRAGNLVLSNGDTSKTWAAVANTNNSTMVEPGAAAPLSSQSPFGADVSTDDAVTVTWTNGNQSKELDVWNAERLTPGG